MSDLNNQSTAAFRKTHPVDFNLFDDDDQQVLYIDDSPDGHNLHLEIRNTSRQSIDLIPPASADIVKATAENNHFELRFRPGTLFAFGDALGKLTLAKVSLNGTPLTAAQWSIGNQKQPDDGTVSLYFLATNAQPPLTLTPDSTLKLTIQNISADAGGGARGTRVELKYELTSIGDKLRLNGAGVKHNGTRIQHIGIVNERGKKHIPLHFGFVGSNTILNDGKDNDRIIQITNVLRDDKIPLSTDKKAPSKFILSFEAYEEKEENSWALGKKDEVWQIHLDELDAKGEVINNPNWEIEQPKGEAQTPQWIIKPKSGKTSLNPNESVRFKVSYIKSDMRSGTANVYLRYENFPGYWDGQFVAALEKSNLIQRDRLEGDKYTNNSDIGIGTNKPLGKLHIIAKGGFGGENTDGTSQKGDVPIVAQSKSTAIGIINSSGRQAFALNVNDDKGTTAERGVITFHDKYDGAWHSSLTLKKGNVGINTATPGFPLTFADDLGDKISLWGQSGNNYGFGIQSALLQIHTDTNGADIAFGYGPSGTFKETMRVKGNGKVGIGTSKPLGTLSISSVTSQNNTLNQTIGELTFVGFNRTVASASILAQSPGWDDWSHLIFKTSEDYTGAQERMRITTDGRVGIGANAPAGRLHISEGSGTTAGASRGTIVIDHENNGGASSIVFRSKYNRDSDYGYIQYQDDATVNGGGESSCLIIGIENDSDDHLILKPAGNVGICIDIPTAPLHVGNNRTMHHWIKDQYSYIAYTWHSGRSNDFRWGKSDKHGDWYDFPNVSICAEGRIVGLEFNALSDLRIKRNLSVSDPNDDLNLLKQFRVTNYKHKDFLTHGNPDTKGFIAQEVEQIFPQAVHQRSDFIPDIYTFAKETTLDGGVLTVTLNKAHNLAAGDTVMLVTQTEGVKEVRVEIVDEKTFSVSNWQGTGGNLFVHGRKVDDFRTLDYQQIFTLGISGIQQLSKEVDELKAANDALKKRLQLMESKMETVANLNASKKAA
jgi:hypothetical protein